MIANERFSEADYRHVYKLEKAKLDRFVEHARQQGVELVHDQADEETGFKISDLLDQYPERRPYVIEGLLRRGEIMNVIAAPKVGKSWLTYSLILSLAHGCPWLGFATEQSPVLLIDNELHKDELSYRIREVAFAMRLDVDDLPIQIEALRGQQCDINTLERLLARKYKRGDFGLLFIDSFYRLLPAGVSENDNASLTAIYNQLDSIATHHDASICQIHHASKGDQTQKGITDVGAGAGAMTRATDSHLVIRPHEDASLAVFDAVTRSSRQPESFSAAFEWPLWRVDGAEPKLQQRKTDGAKQREADNKAADEEILKLLEDGRKRSESWLAGKVSFGKTRCKSTLNRLVSQKRLSRRFGKSKFNGRKIAIYRRINDENASA